MTDPSVLGARLGVGFGICLRSAGISVPTGSVVTFLRCLADLGLADRQRVYWAAHACFVRRPEDREAFDRAFAGFFHDRRAVGVDEPPAAAATLAMDAGGSDDEQGPAWGPDAGGDGELLALRWSSVEVLRHKDFAECTPGELAETHRLIARLRIPASTRPSRRRLPAAVARGDIHISRTVRRALRTDAEALHLERTRPGERARRLVLICDVSGSMEPYSRALLRFAHASAVGRRRVEVFAVGTRLTRLTRALRSRDPDTALAEASAAIVDFSGGTRLGSSIRRFADEWGVRGLARGSVLVICSDGWDRGDPAVLGEAMARLARVAHRIVWLNPLKASPGYAPLARGMAAALPHVDDFVEGHSVRSLEHLAALLAA